MLGRSSTVFSLLVGSVLDFLEPPKRRTYLRIFLIRGSKPKGDGGKEMPKKLSWHLPTNFTTSCNISQQKRQFLGVSNWQAICQVFWYEIPAFSQVSPNL